ncbi:MAG: hypothetical protein ACXVJN_13965 [Mucilaginibacter sp.]
MATTSKTSFFLDKTYLDCIDDAGNCFILYSATIKLLFFKLHYAALIFSDQYNRVTERSSFHKSMITFSNDLLSFSDKFLNIRGDWEKAGDSIECSLYSNSSGIVNWDCHHPIAHCNIIYKNHSFSGLGYTETLFLSIKPWKLPIDELRWGRFLAPGIAVTWIRWAGKNPINKIYCNGEEFNDAVHSGEAIIFNEGKNKLIFFNTSVIRQAKFSDHLSKAPLLKLFVNRAILNSVESKYKSKTVFTDASGVTHNGWSIFEIVKWEH